MKRTPLLLAVTLILGFAISATADYTPPTDAQVVGLLANPSGLGDLVEGATPQQVADVVLRAIVKIDAATALTEDDKKQLVAVLTAEAVTVTGDDCPAAVAAIAKGVGEKWLPVVVAAGTVAAGNLGGKVLDAIVLALGADTPAAQVARDAAADPVGVLGHGIYLLVLQIVTPPAPGGLVPPPYEGQKR